MATAQTGTINALLRGEIAATESYNQALEKFAGQAGEAELRRLRDQHRAAANTLREHVHQNAGEPSTGSGLWGAWARLVEGTAKLLGNTSTLKALKEGEEHGANRYQAALDNADVLADLKSLIRTTLLPQTQAHVQALDRLMGAQTSS